MAEEGGVDEAGRRCFSFNFKKGILVFSTGLVPKMDPFYCLVAKMRPFIVHRPN